MILPVLKMTKMLAATLAAVLDDDDNDSDATDLLLTGRTEASSEHSSVEV